MVWIIIIIIITLFCIVDNMFCIVDNMYILLLLKNTKKGAKESRQTQNDKKLHVDNSI